MYVRDRETEQNRKVGELHPGASFGEMSILAGVPRNATIVVPAGSKAQVLEVRRPALRLLRKLPKFGQMLDANYRKHGLGRTLIDVRQVTGTAFSPELIEKLGKSARFMVYATNHSLFHEGEAVDRSCSSVTAGCGRVRGGLVGAAASDYVEGRPKTGRGFPRAGNCLGLEGIPRTRAGPTTATVLPAHRGAEVALPRLRADPRLRDDALERSFSDFSLADDDVELRSVDQRLVAATEREIATGVVDGTNLLVMDMDKCVRCGNCSMACHQVHGQSRLLRRGIHIERPTKLGSTTTQHVLVPSVCMHCQDPECLTGCPTGAIGRFENGQID